MPIAWQPVNVHKLLNDLELSHSEAAEALGVKRNSLYRWEAERRMRKGDKEMLYKYALEKLRNKIRSKEGSIPSVKFIIECSPEVAAVLGKFLKK